MKEIQLVILLVFYEFLGKSDVNKKEDIIQEQLIARGIKNPQVLKAMREVDRADFVPVDFLAQAYDDRPLPIGYQQTISQPYIVAYMAEQLQLSAQDRVLEFGTGCGYNAAVISKIVEAVYSIEIIDELADLAELNLSHGNYPNLHIRVGDGYKGWPDEAPFDAIILTAAPAVIPEPLKKQLTINGRSLAPVGIDTQDLILITRTSTDTFEEQHLLAVNFVPMAGKAQSGRF